MNMRTYSHLVLLLGLIVGGFHYMQNSESDLSNQLDQIFEADNIKVTIPHHGGYTPRLIGEAILKIKLQPKDSTYLIHFKDAIDKRQLDFSISRSEFKKLKKLFEKLIKIHDPNKKLSGDCITIDQNYILETKELSLIIKPIKESANADCVMNWIYGKELNK